MMKLLPLTALALSLSSGVALADRHGGESRDHRAAVVEHRAPAVRDHRVYGGGGGYRGNVVARGNFVREGRGWHGGDRVIVRDRPYFRGGVVRRPIFVGRPVIRGHFYNYDRRPGLIVENYAAMPGYFWVAGHWYWSGYEWQWEPGHYQPDPNYVDPAYGYDSGY